MSVRPRLGKISESEFQSAEMPVGSGRREGGRDAKRGSLNCFIPFRNVYWGYWVTAATFSSAGWNPGKCNILLKWRLPVVPTFVCNKFLILVLIPVRNHVFLDFFYMVYSN